jgi:DNA-binding NarL/FixJ family response regulator
MRKTCTPAAGKSAVMIAQREPVMLMGLTCLINGHERLKVCAQASSANMALELCEMHRPEVVVVDLELDASGTCLLRDLTRRAPESRSIVFTRLADALSVQRSLSAGALGYVTWQDPAVDVVTTILRVLEGQRHLGQKAQQLILDQMACGKMDLPGSAEMALSDRELQVYRMIGLGKAMREVAAVLHISTKTVETHRHRIKAKLHLHSGADLQRRAMLFCHALSTLPGKGFPIRFGAATSEPFVACAAE